eukprot:6459366-Amphidinium_carterae.2
MAAQHCAWCGSCGSTSCCWSSCRACNDTNYTQTKTTADDEPITKADLALMQHGLVLMVLNAVYEGILGVKSAQKNKELVVLGLVATYMGAFTAQKQGSMNIVQQIT